MNTPTCVWNPITKGSPHIPRWRPSNLTDRTESPHPLFQSRDANDTADRLRMNLRQAKDALTIRDEETRKLRSAVTHLESVLSKRERELRDTVLCMRGECPPRPNQEWLQEGTPTSRLRLQVHQLQRIVAAKQDHIEHLNRQASLGFLREAREQADEYRGEARRLGWALARVTGRPGVAARVSADLPGDNATSPVVSYHGVASSYKDGGDRDRVNHATAGSVGHGQTNRPATPTIQPLSQLGLAMSPSSGRGDGHFAHELHTLANRGPSYFPKQDGREGPALGPSLMRGSKAEVASPASSVGRCPIRWRAMPCESLTIRPPNDPGVMATSWTPPAVALDTVQHDTLARGMGKPQRSIGGASGKLMPRGNRGGTSVTPGRPGVLRENKRTSSMAASARLRSSARQRASEKHDALTLDEESRRLQAARAERARRVRLAKRKIARYREKRLVELESRLARRSGTRPPDKRRPMGVPEEERHRDDDGGIGEGAVKNTENTNYENPPRSKQRRSIEAAISASMAGNSGIEEQHRFGFEREHTGAAEVDIQREDTCPQGYQRNQPWGIDLNRKGPPLREHPSVEVRDCPARPLGRPPLAPSRAAQSRKLSIRKQSSVGRGERRVDETGDVAEEYGWDDEYDEYDDAEEVQTETASGGSGNEGELWGDDGGSEESVREDCVIAREWGGDLGAEEVSTPMKDVRTGNALLPRGSHRRHRNWIGSERDGNGLINAVNSRLLGEKVGGPANAVSLGEVPRVGSTSAGRSGPRTEHDPRPSPVDHLLDAAEIVQPAVTLEGHSGDRIRGLGAGRWQGPDEGGGSTVDAMHGRSDTGKFKNPAISAESGTRKIKRRGGSGGDKSGGRIDSPNREFKRSVDARAHHDPLGGPGTRCENGGGELCSAFEGREASQAQTGDHKRGGEAGRVENGGVLGGRNNDRHCAAEGTTLLGDGRQATGNFGSSREEEPNDDASYESRWSLSEDDETRAQGAAWRVRAEGYHDDNTGKAAEKETRAVGHGRGAASSGFEASAGTSRDDTVAPIATEYQDDFSDKSATKSQGTITPFAVSSPSDEEAEGFAPLHIDANPSAPNPEVGPPTDSLRENTAVDGWLVNELPSSTARGGLLENASETKGLRRPRSIGVSKPDIRPASPRVPRFNLQGAAERERFDSSAAEASSERVDPSDASSALLQDSAVRREDAATTATATERRPRFHRAAENDSSRHTKETFQRVAVKGTFTKEETVGEYPHGGRATVKEDGRPSLAANEPPRNDEISQGRHEQSNHQIAFRESDDWPEHPVTKPAAGATEGDTAGATTARPSAPVAKQEPTEPHARSVECKYAQARRVQASLRGEIAPNDAAPRTAAESSPMGGDLDDDSLGATGRSKTPLPALSSGADAVGTGVAFDAARHGIASTSTFALSDNGTDALGDGVSSTVSLDIKLPPEIHRSRDDFDVGHTASGDSLENQLKLSSPSIDPQVSTDYDDPFLTMNESKSSLLSGAGQPLVGNGSGDVSSKNLDPTLSNPSVSPDAEPGSSSNGPLTSQPLEGGQVVRDNAGNAPFDSTSPLPSMSSSSGRVSPRENRFTSSAVGASVQKAPEVSPVYDDVDYRRSSLEEGESIRVRLEEGVLAKGGLSRSGSSLDIEAGGGGSNDDDDGYF